jgi:hypothetical protein
MKFSPNSVWRTVFSFVFLLFSLLEAKIPLMIPSEAKPGRFDKIYFPNRASVARYGVVWDYAVIYAPLLDIKSVGESMEFCRIGFFSILKIR